MSKTIAIVIGLILLVALLLFSMTYTVNYHEVAIKTRFGKEGSVINQPGLKFRLPLFADRVSTFDTRVQLRESPLETVQTADGQQIVVKAFMLWQVDTQGNAPLTFSQNYASVEEANVSLGDQFKTAMRQGLSRFSFDELIGDRSRLPDAEAAILKEMSSVTSKGIKPVSVGVSQLVLPPRTAQAVLTRMQASRTQLSDQQRGRGQAEAAAIQNRAAADADKIKAFAEQLAADIRAKGEEEAARYITAMSEAEDLAIFLSWCDTLTSSLSKYSTLVLPSNFAPWHLMTPNGSLDHKGIPQPPQSQPEIARRAAPPAMIASPNTDAAPAASDSGTHPEPNSNPERTDG
jgi:membrane protease subunit HflC